jgi:hypothetical protein
MPKLTQQYVSNFLKERGCKLISEYKCSREHITYIAKCGHERTSPWDHTRRQKDFLCIKCKTGIDNYKVPPKLSTEEVKNTLIKNGSELLSSYISRHSNITLKCSKDSCKKPFTKTYHILMTYNRFMCDDCWSKEKREISINNKQNKTTKHAFNSTSAIHSGFKTCNKCNILKPVEDYAFERNGKDGRKACCKDCLNNCKRKRRENLDIDGLIGRMLSHTKSSSIKREVIDSIRNKDNTRFEYSLTKEIIKNIIKLQDNKCIYTNVNFVWKYGDKNMASIDRIDSSKGYVKDNIQLVLKSVNIAKSNMTEDQFYKFRKLLANIEYTNIECTSNNIISPMTILSKMKRGSIDAAKRLGEIDSKNGKDFKRYEHNIDEAIIQEVARNQDNKCVYTGVELVWDKDADPLYKASLDRKDSTLGYTRENIQLISYACNVAKSDMTSSEWLLFRQKLSENL